MCVRGRGESYMCVCEGPGGELHVCVRGRGESYMCV